MGQGSLDVPFWGGFEHLPFWTMKGEGPFLGGDVRGNIGSPDLSAKVWHSVEGLEGGEGTGCAEKAPRQREGKPRNGRVH